MMTTPLEDNPLKFVADRIRQTGLIAIVRGRFTIDQLLAIGETLLHNDIPVIEITLNTTASLAGIQRLRQQLGSSLLIGAGSVRTSAQWDAAIRAGAAFTVAPNFDPETVQRALAKKTLHLPGVYTATEAQTAYRAGATLLKLFPAAAGGPGYLAALRAPLDDIDFVPTGGITAANIPAFKKAGALAVGIGSALVREGLTPADLAHRAAALRAAWDNH